MHVAMVPDRSDRLRRRRPDPKTPAHASRREAPLPGHAIFSGRGVSETRDRANRGGAGL